MQTGRYVRLAGELVLTPVVLSALAGVGVHVLKHNTQFRHCVRHAGVYYIDVVGL